MAQPGARIAFWDKLGHPEQWPRYGSTCSPGGSNQGEAAKIEKARQDLGTVAN